MRTSVPMSRRRGSRSSKNPPGARPAGRARSTEPEESTPPPEPPAEVQSDLFAEPTAPITSETPPEATGVFEMGPTGLLAEIDAQTAASEAEAAQAAQEVEALNLEVGNPEEPTAASVELEAAVLWPVRESEREPEAEPEPEPEERNGRLRILWIGTKAPLPASDGGRLVAWQTLRALAEAGHEVVFVAPAEGSDAQRAELADELRTVCEPVLTKPRRRPALDDLLRMVLGPQPVTIRRHFRAKVAAAVAGRLATGRFDVVHCEQVHSVAQASPAFSLGVPVLLRQQNVESELWMMMGRQNPLLRPLLALEAARVRRYEAHVMRRVAVTVALTVRDGERLRAIAGPHAEVRTIRAPFPPDLPAADGVLTGTPAVVLFGDPRWQPNRLQIQEFARALWPRVHDVLPEARLHLFGGGLRRVPAGVVEHGLPAESREAFVPGSVLVVPLRVASGVRMKILEAWARGVPVVATTQAAAGLDCENGRELLLADDADGFARALGRLATEPGLAEHLVAGGRRALRDRHTPRAIAAELGAAYRWAIASCAGEPRRANARAV